MPNLSTRDVNKMAEMFDQHFYQLMERIDKNYEDGGRIEPPKPRKQQRLARIPENVLQQQLLNQMVEQLSQQGPI